MLPFADTDEEFVLDLQGVSNLPSLFFNMCLKRFVEDRGAEFVKSRGRRLPDHNRTTVGIYDLRLLQAKPPASSPQRLVSVLACCGGMYLDLMLFRSNSLQRTRIVR